MRQRCFRFLRLLRFVIFFSFLRFLSLVPHIVGLGWGVFSWPVVASSQRFLFLAFMHLSWVVCACTLVDLACLGSLLYPFRICLSSSPLSLVGAILDFFGFVLHGPNFLPDRWRKRFCSFCRLRLFLLFSSSSSSHPVISPTLPGL